MTKEQKDLLLKDLCTRLPYNPMVEYKGETYNVLGIISGRLILCKPFMSCALNEHPLVEEVKLYLYPLSNMTDEQYNDFFAYFHNVEINEIKISGDYLKAAYLGENAKRDWLNKNHFDYNYHIEKGIVLDATGLNIY